MYLVQPKALSILATSFITVCGFYVTGDARHPGKCTWVHWCQLCLAHEVVLLRLKAAIKHVSEQYTYGLHVKHLNSE